MDNQANVTLLGEAGPAVPFAAAADVLRTDYGLTGELDRLPGEADDNFLLRTPEAGGYVLKFAHPMTDPEVIDTQVRALRQLAASTDLPVQRVVPTLDGLPRARAQERIVLVTTYLPGTQMREVAMTEALRRQLGATLAVLAQALKEVPAKPRPLLWDIAQLTQLRPLAAELPPRFGRDLLTALIDRFAQSIEPRLKYQRTQLVHNDFNVDNVLIDAGRGRVDGILDFGDMTVTALVNDVAIAACYHITVTGEQGAAGGGQPAGGAEPAVAEAALDVIAGYHASTPLTDEELDLLPGLMLARLTARVAISRWRALRFPDNEDYLLRSTAMAWGQLNRLLAVPERELAERIHAKTEQPDA